MERFGIASFPVNLCAAGTTGAISTTFAAPLERVKLLIQTQDANPRIISGEVPRYTGIVNCFMRVAREQGYGAFWRGNTVNVIRKLPVFWGGFPFALKDVFRGWFHSSNQNPPAPTLATNMAAGAMAGVGPLAACRPLDYVRFCLASDIRSGNSQFNGVADCLTKIVRQGGFLSMYAGFVPQALKSGCFRGLQFGLYDTLKELTPNIWGVSFASKYLVAHATSMCGLVVTYPYDTVRRRLMMQAEKPKEQWLYNGTLDCAVKIVKDEGVGAMFKGFAANVLRTLGGALVLVGYDEIKRMIGQ